ncbi:adhesion G protein-coupled receptor E2, partial [Biomphalaria glabrata]
MTDSQGLKTCPRGKFGVKCRQTCYCDWTGAKFCHQRTGQCICHTGFQGSLCEEDIDECHTNGATACPAKFTACENTFGSYNCRCQRGYERNPLSLQCK